MLARQARNLLIIKDLSKDKNEAEIVKITHLHPFVVKKSLSQVRNFDMSDLLAFHKTILDADLALKTSSTNPKLVLTKLVYSFTK
jgi:DNA polymerase III delta subunit